MTGGQAPPAQPNSPGDTDPGVRALPPVRTRWDFVFRMAWRESRQGVSRQLFFILGIAVGVGALVGVSSFAHNLEAAIQREARALMAADLEVRVGEALDPAAEATLQALGSRGVQRAQLAEFTSMVLAAETQRSQVVEVKAVEGAYPFYGQLELDPAGLLEQRLLPGQVLVDPELLAQLELPIGASLKLGGATLVIAGRVLREPDRVTSAFSLGPRVLMRMQDARDAGLLEVGGRIRYRHLLALRASSGAPTQPGSGERAAAESDLDLASNPRLEALKAELEANLPMDRVTVRSYQEAQPSLRRFLERMSSFLSLVTLVTLLLGGLGVAQAVRVFLYQKRDTIAVLKVLGATTKEVTFLFVAQCLGLAVVGSMLGIVAGQSVQALLPTVVGEDLPVSVSLEFVPIAALEGLLLGVLTALLFALIPLLSVRGIAPARVLRREEEVPVPRVERLRLLQAGLLLGGGLLGMAIYLAGAWTLGLYFVGAMLAAMLLLYGAARALIAGLKRLPRLGALAWRQGLANVHRPGSQAAQVVVALGLGVAVITMVQLVQLNLLNRVSQDSAEELPNFFFIGLRGDQIQAFEAALAREHAVPTALVPLVQARLARLADREVSELSFENEEEQQFYTREFGVSWLEALPDGNTVVEGRWWTPEQARTEHWVSVEQRAAERLKLKLGDELQVDIQGVRLSAIVTSIRTVDWGRLQTNFFLAFTQAALEGVPVSYVATVKARPGTEARAALQRTIVAELPNVTAINAAETIERVRGILERISGVIRFMAASSILAGMVILIGAIVSTRVRRTRESAILKVLGATRGVVVRILAVEYLALGLVAGLIGTGVAALLAWGVLKLVLEIPWIWRPTVLILAPLLSALLTVLAGALASWPVLSEKPLRVLRDE